MELNDFVTLDFWSISLSICTLLCSYTTYCCIRPPNPNPTTNTSQDRVRASANPGWIRFRGGLVLTIGVQSCCTLFSRHKSSTSYLSRLCESFRHTYSLGTYTPRFARLFILLAGTYATPRIQAAWIGFHIHSSQAKETHHHWTLPLRSTPFVRWTRCSYDCQQSFFWRGWTVLPLAGCQSGLSI